LIVLSNVEMVTNVQPFGVSILISMFGQRWSDMPGCST
jgi:hypothetical protein